jgi:hypothetical protein
MSHNFCRRRRFIGGRRRGAAVVEWKKTVQALGGAAASSDENKTGQTRLRSLSVTKRLTKRSRNLFVMLTHRKHSADFAQIYRMQPSTPPFSLSLSRSALYVLALSPCGDEATPS